MPDPRFEKIKDMVKGRYDGNGDPGHDFTHILRVVASCASIGRSLNADLQTLLPAALLHDVVNVPKDHPDRTKASEQAADEAAGMLSLVGYGSDEIAKIRIIIREHNYSLGLSPSCLESAILQDADRLDAIGAIGLMRMVTCGGRLGSKYDSADEPIPMSRTPDDKAFTIDHLDVKLFKIGETFNTEPARKEGAKRVQFMRRFVEQLESEIQVEKD